MQKAIYILILIACLPACNGNEKKSSQCWQISQISSETYLFKKGSEVKIFSDSISFSTNQQSSTFPIIISKANIIIDLETEKLLFRIETVSDSVWVLHELYNKNPLIIKLISIQDKSSITKKLLK